MGDGGTQWDAPNQQVVRDDASAPWDEGTGGSEEGPVEKTGLDAMTKAELLDHAKSIGASPANSDMTKDELRKSIDDKEAEG
jgi:hypothetical protein